ncbi:zf-HC2 domain-containing protein [Geodermatophilus sp. URMC 60]
MQCTPYREAVSARLDGESPGLPADELDAHLDACPACAAWARQVELVTRRARLAPAPAVPDLTATVLAALPRELPGTVAAARARLATAALRLALLAVGVAQMAFAWPSVVAGTAAMSAPAHMAHETGAWNLGIAAAFLAVAAAPRLAAGALPFLGTFAGLLAVLTVADLRAGHVHAERAVTHLVLLAGVALVGAVAWRGRRRRTVPAVGRERVPA